MCNNIRIKFVKRINIIIITSAVVVLGVAIAPLIFNLAPSSPFLIVKLFNDMYCKKKKKYGWH